jgi:cobalt-zinc-cadmium efflux system protein
MSSQAHAHHGHAHGGHGHHHHHGEGAGGGRYVLAIGLNLAFVVLEAVFGFLSNSTALLADAGHNLSDVLALILAGGAAWLAARPGAAEQRTYGFGKATILAALTNGVVLVFACGAIALEAINRFSAPPPVQPGTIMAVAAAGFVINLLTALLFLRGRHDDVNVKGAFLHMAADAGVSLAVVVSGLMIALTGLAWIDPAVSLLIVAVILFGTWGLLRESLDLAMDVAPASVSVREVRAYLGGLPGVQAVHDMHIWNLSTTQTALTAHLVRAEAGDNAFLSGAMDGLRDRFGIRHATLQVEVGPQDHCPNC